MEWPLLSKSHPILGVFHHNASPSMLTGAGAKFFAEYFEPRHVHEEKKQLRHNPYIDLWQHCPNLVQRSYESFGRAKAIQPRSPKTLLKRRLSSQKETIESKRVDRHGSPKRLRPSPERNFFDEYQLMDSTGRARVLGRGGYSCVQLGCHISTLQNYAIKVITKRYLRKPDIDNVRREISIHRGLSHTNVVRLIEFFEDDEAYQLVVEHCEGGDLQRYVQRPGGNQTLSEKAAINVFQQIVKAVAYVHQHGIIHGDIKPENVLFKKDPFSVVKLCDFGLSRSAKDVRYFRHTGSVSKVPFENKVGTAGYVAPEMFKSQNFGQAIDMWALGVMLFRCLVGYGPFYPASKCASDPLRFHKPDWIGFSDHCQDFLRKLLHPTPDDRLTAMAALTHPWILDRRVI